MTGIDIVSRTAMVVARAVHRRPEGCTYAYARTSIRAADRPLFPQALASAVAVAMVRPGDDGRLYPGGRSPDPWGEDSPPHCVSCTCDTEPELKRCRFKSAHSCRICRRWLEGEWPRATPERRVEIQRQMDAGHCDTCHERVCK